jgi:cell wall-associated NlpC family hydrolase
MDALDASDTTSAPSRPRFRLFRVAFVAGLLAISMLAVQMPVATQAHSRTEAQRIVAIARSHIGARFRLGSTGPRTFDCSGLIYRVYKQAGLLNRVGGSRKLAAGYYYWFKHRGQVSRSHPKVGDLVIWTHKGRIAHSGIYVGNGHVISALINPWGVKRTHIRTLHAKFFAFLHVKLQR